jgi:AcrR family transcriptional regulator
MTKHDGRRRFSRQVWLERAAEHILSRGLAAFSVRSFAAQYGVSTQALISHFGRRDQLVEEALRETFRGGKLAAEQLVHEMSTIESLFDSLVQSLQNPEFFRRNAIQLELIATAALTPDSHSDFAARITQRVHGIIEAKAREEGVEEADVTRVAAFLVAITRGIIMDALGGRTREQLQMIVEQAMVWYRGQLEPAKQRQSV